MSVLRLFLDRGHSFLKVFTTSEHGEGRGLRRYYRVAWGVPGNASVAVGGRVEGRKVGGGITTLLRAHD